MKLESLRLKNFLSFKELNHVFQDGAVLIQGRNLTEDSKETNGSGKSTLEAGISYALMATSLRKQTLDRDLIRWGEDEAEIELTIYCPVRGQRLRIFRKLRIKGSSVLELYLNEQPVAVASVIEGNRYILDWLGMTSDDLRSYYILNKENYKSFLSASNTDKLSLINRFMGVDQLELADDVVKSKSAPYIDCCNAAQKGVAVVEGELNVYRSQLEEELNRNLDEELEEQVSAINDQISSYQSSIQQYRQKIVTLQSSRKDLVAELANYKDELHNVKDSLDELVKDNSLDIRKTAISQQRCEVDSAVTEARNLRNEDYKSMAEVDKVLSALNKVLAGVITCPHCHHRFILNDENKSVADVEQELSEKTHDLETYKSEIQEINALLDSLAEEVSSYDSMERTVNAEICGHNSKILVVKKQITDMEHELYEKQALLQKYGDEIERYEKSIEIVTNDMERAENGLKKLMEDGIQSKVEEYKGLVSVTEKKLQKAEDKLQKAECELGELQQWGQRFKDFRMSLACEQLKVIQDAANMSLERQKSELRVSIDGFKRNAKGQMKSEITVLVINGEGEYKSFWSYSGGERARVEMAMIQAFQEVLNTTNPYGGLNFLMIDEVLEGTDPLGLSLLMESMNNVESPVYIISHVMNIRAGVPTLTVIKENGVSRME